MKPEEEAAVKASAFQACFYFTFLINSMQSYNTSAECLVFCFLRQMIEEEGWQPITNVDKDKPWTAEEIDMMYMIEGKVEDMHVRRYVALVSS